MNLFTPDIEKLKQQGKVPELVKALTHRRAEVRASAAKALGEQKAKAACTPLIKALLDPSEAVRDQAVWALGELGEVEAVPHLVRLFDSPEAGTPFAAACAAVQIGLPALQSIFAYLDEKHWNDNHVKEALLEMGETLIRPLADAIFAQAAAGKPTDTSLAYMLALLRDIKWTPENWAADDPACILKWGVMQEWGKIENLGPVALQPLLILLRHFQQCSYMKYLGWDLNPSTRHVISYRPGDEGYIAMLTGMLVRFAGNKAEPLIPPLKAKWQSGINNKQFLMRALGQIGSPLALETLVDCMRIDDLVMRKTALQALTLVKWTPANRIETHLAKTTEAEMGWWKLDVIEQILGILSEAGLPAGKRESQITEILAQLIKETPKKTTSCTCGYPTHIEGKGILKDILDHRSKVEEFDEYAQRTTFYYCPSCQRQVGIQNG